MQFLLIALVLFDGEMVLRIIDGYLRERAIIDINTAIDIVERSTDISGREDENHLIVVWVVRSFKSRGKVIERGIALDWEVAHGFRIVYNLYDNN